jgi:hypothetical protein
LELPGLAVSEGDPEVLSDACACALERLMGAGATAEVAFKSLRVDPLGQVAIDEATLTMRGWALRRLPHPTHVSALAENSAHAEPGRHRPVLIRRLDVLFDDIRLAGLRCRRIEVAATNVSGDIEPDGDGALLTLREAAGFDTRGEIHATDVRDYLVSEAPWIIGGTVNFVNGARLVADGKVRLGFFPVSGRLSGTLAVANSTDLLIENVSVTVAGRRIPDGIVAGKLREVNPLITLRPLVEAGLGIELLPPEADGSVLRLHGRARTR